MRHKTSKCRRIRKIEWEAASRTLNGNGASPSLPPLPTTNDVCNAGDEQGLATLFSHPYGALPYGNIYTAPPPPSNLTNINANANDNVNSSKNMDWVRHEGLGPLVRHLNDEQLLSVTAFLDGHSLSRLVQCSRYLYVAGHHDELWRDLTLRSFGTVGFDFQNSWRDTYVKNHPITNTLTTTPNLTRTTNPSHQPIKINGIYSDIFFRSWLCRSFALQPSFLTYHNTVPVEHASKLTTHRFLTEYEDANCPLLIQDATLSWPAVQKWSTEYLVDVTRGVDFRATSGAAPIPATFTMERYAGYCAGGGSGSGGNRTEEAPLYLFDRNFRKNCPRLVEDYREALRESCPYFDDGAEHGHDLFSLLGEEKRPDYCWIIAGPKRYVFLLFLLSLSSLQSYVPSSSYYLTFPLYTYIPIPYSKTKDQAAHSTLTQMEHMPGTHPSSDANDGYSTPLVYPHPVSYRPPMEMT